MDLMSGYKEFSLISLGTRCVVMVLKTFPSATKYLKTIVSFGKVTPEQKEEVEKFGLAIYAWDEFLLLGDDKQYDLPVKKKSDICTIMYTSGTTGDPKGVLISNNSIVTLIDGVRCLLGSVHELLTEKDVNLSYLPLAHIFDRLIEECFINIGGSIGFWHGDVKLLTEDIGELKPTIFCAVPRVLDRIYAGLQQKISSGGLLKNTMFNFADSYSIKDSGRRRFRSKRFRSSIKVILKLHRQHHLHRRGGQSSLADYCTYYVAYSDGSCNHAQT
ncbi:long chain acyl-CoA synthetase 4-like isoform X2 [Camellia sinensis]|uniref:long chain acyl-CoA synthetase 4-like isoform X2 n=1 Tax=Camellia sinensis TaxID=4442 RepID=UPI001035B9C9|nr:long chain acyl-CoA synthetase 4-like isoform X2 [Camellia sinensis]